VNEFRAIPPVLAPVPWRALLGAALDGSSAAEAAEDAGAAVSAFLGGGRALFFSSGRAAMTVALKVLRGRKRGTEVIIPAYTCPTVPSAVAAAGLVCVPCDIAERDFGFDLEVLERCFCSETLCVIPTHLYGLPCDAGEVVRRAKQRGVAVLEDAAQGLGGAWKGQPLGTLGDLGMYSLGRGKNLTTGHGGILLVKDEGLAEEIERAKLKPAADPVLREAPAMARMALMSLLARPPFYGRLARVPALEIGVSRFDPKIEVGPLGRFELELLRRMLPAAGRLAEGRARIAEQYARGLNGMEHVVRPVVSEGARAAWLRFPILLPEAARERLMESPIWHLGLSGSYPAAVPEIPGVEPFVRLRCPIPGATTVARRIVTLPTHCRVGERHVRRIMDCLRRLQ